MISGHGVQKAPSLSTDGARAPEWEACCSGRLGEQFMNLQIGGLTPHHILLLLQLSRHSCACGIAHDYIENASKPVCCCRSLESNVECRYGSSSDHTSKSGVCWFSKPRAHVSRTPRCGTFILYMFVYLRKTVEVSYKVCRAVTYVHRFFNTCGTVGCHFKARVVANWQVAGCQAPPDSALWKLLQPRPQVDGSGVLGVKVSRL